MNQSMTRSARALSSSRRAPTRHTAMSSLHIRAIAALSPLTIDVNSRSAVSTTTSAVAAGMAGSYSLLFAVVSGVGNRQPTAHEGAQAGADVIGAPVHLAAPNR